MTLSDVRIVFIFAFALALTVGAGVAGVGSLDGSAATGQNATQNATRISTCTTINQSGTYVLTKNVENGGKTRISGTCFEIIADDVTFDGNGHTIDGRGVSHTKGVAVVGATNVTVGNFTVEDWHEGVLVENASATVRDVHSATNAYGIRLENAAGSTVENNTVEDNLVGIYVDSENVTLAANDLSGNEIGVKRATGPEFRAPSARVRLPALRA